MFTRVCPGDRCVDPWSLGSLARVPLVSLGLSGMFGFTLRIVGLIRGRWVHLGTPLGSMGSPGVVVFTRMRPGGRWFRLGSLRSPARALGIDEFISCRWVSSRAPWRSLCTSGGVTFTCVHPQCRWIHLGSLCSLARPCGR